MTGHVLVVDDDEDIRESLGDVLRAEGYTVSVAADGAQALELLHSGNRPGLVLVDMIMPVMDGAELLARMASDPELRKLPVLVISASSIIEPPEGVPVMRKPLRLDRLIAAIEHLGR